MVIQEISINKQYLTINVRDLTPGIHMYCNCEEIFYEFNSIILIINNGIEII